MKNVAAQEVNVENAAGLVAAILPLWFWEIWWALGLGLLVFSLATLAAALRENAKDEPKRQSKKAIPSDATTGNGKSQSDTEKGIAENTLIIEEKREDVKP